MRWSDLPVKPSTRMLRQFAGLWILFFGALSAWNWTTLHRPYAAAVFLVLAVTVGPVGVLFPRVIRPGFAAWLGLAFPIGWVVSKVVLMFIFWVVMTPVGMLFRATGRDLLQRRRRHDVTTYWKPKPRAGDLASYFRQF